MKSKILVFCIAYLFVFFISCTNKTRYPQEVAVLDSLQQQLVLVEKEVRSVDTVQIISRVKTLNDNLLYFQTNTKDTINKETAVFIGNYLGLKNPFEIFIGRKDKFIKEVVYTEEQLKKLSHDLNKNLIEKEKAKEYFEAEAQKAKALIESAGITVKGMRESMVRFDSLNLKMEEMVQQVKLKKESVEAK